MTDFDRERKRNLSQIKKKKKLHLLFPQIAFTNGADELKKEFISSTQFLKNRISLKHTYNVIDDYVFTLRNAIKENSVLFSNFETSFNKEQFTNVRKKFHQQMSLFEKKINKSLFCKKSISPFYVTCFMFKFSFLVFRSILVYFFFNSLNGKPFRQDYIQKMHPNTIYLKTFIYLVM